MLSFKTFLLEYLTPEQREHYSQYDMTNKARGDTDHFFGVNNDSVREEIKGYEHGYGSGSETPKSDLHKEIEAHIAHHTGRMDLSHEEYKNNSIADKYGRKTKVSKLITDKNLLDRFNNDPDRKVGRPYATIHRGVEVAGQTNSTPNALHPKGHSWAGPGGSCKDNSIGRNKHYLPREIQNGTVTMFVHDHDGKEIYRASMQPHHNELGHTAYAVDSEYGIKHPAFTRHAHDVARRLSGQHKGGSLSYTRNNLVYQNNSDRVMSHPGVSSTDLMDMLDPKNTPDVNDRISVLRHPNIDESHITKALQDPDSDVHQYAIKHHKVTSDHITTVLKDPKFDELTKRYALSYSNNRSKIAAEHIDLALKHDSPAIRAAAFHSPNVTTKHIDIGLNDRNESVRGMAVNHQNATSKQIRTGLQDVNHSVNWNAITNPNATANHITSVLKDSNHNFDTKLSAISHKNANASHITSVLKDPKSDFRLKLAALNHGNANADHVTSVLKDPKSDFTLKLAALENRNVNADHISTALKDPDPNIKSAAFNHVKVNADHITSVLKDPNSDYDMKLAAFEHPNATANHITSVLTDSSHDLDTKLIAIRHKNANASHITSVLKDPNSHYRLKLAALNHKNATDRHYDIALNDSNASVRNAAEYYKGRI